MVIKNGMPVVKVKQAGVAYGPLNYTKLPTDFTKNTPRQPFSKKMAQSYQRPKHQSMMDNYYNTKSTWRDSHPASMAGTFYTEISAAKEILNTEK